MKKTIKDLELRGKSVIIRCDLNVPLKDGVITDDNRIIESIATIKYALDEGAKLIIFSHLGRVKEEKDKETNSLAPVAVRLSELLGKDVKFSPETRGPILEEMVKSLNEGDVLLVENTRFEDLDGNKESGNDRELAKYWASFGDVFINDAYGSSHRAHASTVGIPTFLENAVGFLVEKEVTVLDEFINDPKRPFVVILGGAKVKDKIGVIESLVTKTDKILIGGGMSYTFIKALGNEVGKSLLDADSLDFCKRILSEYPEKIILPVDFAVTKEFDANAPSRIARYDDIQEDEMGMDIGPETLEKYEEELKDAAQVIWNGPVGVFEFERFAVGTNRIAEILSSGKTKVLIGGGDSAAAVIGLGYKDKFYHIATGGGATLEYLEGKVLPGIDIIKNK